MESRNYFTSVFEIEPGVLKYNTYKEKNIIGISFLARATIWNIEKGSGFLQGIYALQKLNTEQDEYTIDGPHEPMRIFDCFLQRIGLRRMLWDIQSRDEDYSFDIHYTCD